MQITTFVVSAILHIVAGHRSDQFRDFDGLVQWNQTIIATNDVGTKVPSLTASLGIGRRGPLLAQDLNLQNHLSHFVFERIPERVVHAKGAGAFGYFEITNPDIAKYTGAKLFERAGKKTQAVVRFSTVSGELGSADSVNDLRGFAVKFYTEDGNYDMLMLNTQAYNLRDPILFPSVSRSRKRNPRTHLLDNNMYWDFTSLRPETTFATFLLFSDAGFPKSYKHMTGFAINTFKWTGGNNKTPIFVRYHMVPTAGKKISSSTIYEAQAGSDPDYFIRDLYEDIDSGKYPSYTLNVQMMTLEKAKTVKFNPFDPTKIFPLKDFPLIPVGKLVLNRNPTDYFNDVEQIGFQPGNLVPGIEISADRVLQGRIFPYASAQRHRLGINSNQIPVNAPLRQSESYSRDGFASTDSNGDGGPNYYPNSFGGPIVANDAVTGPQVSESICSKGEQVQGYFDVGEDDNYSQVNDYWRDQMSEKERQRTVAAIARHLSKASLRIQNQSLRRNWDPVNVTFSRMLREQLSLENELGFK